MKNTVYFILRVFLFVLSLALLSGWGLEANAQVQQLRSGTSNGAKWSSGGVYTNFGVVGQSSIATQIGGGDYSGSVGFLFSQLGVASANEAPVALSDPSNSFRNLENYIELFGYDPEGAAITFEITQQPVYLIAVQDGIDGELISLSPTLEVLPDVVYSDSLKFIVKEADTDVISNEATVLFSYKLDDTNQKIIDFAVAGSTFTLSFTDVLKNPSYQLDINYYDLSDVGNAHFVPMLAEEVAVEGFNISNDTLDYSFEVSDTEHPYVFDTDQVFITVLVTADNGFSDFASYILDNTGSGRILTSEDGQFFVIGSTQSVPENRSIDLQMIAVEFADFDMSAATLEIISNGTRGELDNISQVDLQANIITWEATYTATEEVGGLDEVEFRVFHPGRNLYDTALVNITIIDVNDPPTIGEVLDQQMDEDATLNVNVSYGDPDNELTITVASDEASSVIVSESEGVINIAPVADFFGTTNITVTASESGTTDNFVVVETFEVNILSQNDAPIIAAISNKVTDEDVSVNVALDASDPDTDFQLFDYSASSSNPAIANVSVVDNLLTVSPVANANGTVTISVTADDRTGSNNSTSDAIAFDVVITAINDAPILLQTLETQVLVQDFPAYEIDLGAYFSDVETASEALDYSVIGNTNVLVSIAGSIATVSLTPGYSGVENLVFTAVDDSESVNMDVSFVVNQLSADIVINSTIDDISLEEDFGSFQLSFLDVFTDQNNPNAVFTYELMGNANVAFTLDSDAQTITFLSPDDFNGVESLFLVATRNGSSSYTTFDLSITAVNDAPVLYEIENQSIIEDASFTDLLIEISDIDNSNEELTLTAVSSNQELLSDADITISNNNGFFFMAASPLANQNGVVAITVTLSDGSLSVETTFSLNIASINDLPEVVEGFVEDATQDVAYSVDLASLFADPDGDVLTYSIVNQATWLTLEGTVLSGTPSNDNVGTEEMQITATDPFDEQVIGLYAFEVANVNDAPRLLNPIADITVLQENSFSYLFPTASFEDIDVDEVLTYTIEQFPLWATLTGNNLTGNPQYEDIGVSEIVFKATDAAGAFVMDTISVTVQFTVYDADVTASNTAICAGESAELVASGAVDYNWYDADGNLVQEGGESYTSSPSSSLQVFVEGKDAEGNLTPDKVAIDITVNDLPDASISQNGDELSVTELSNASYVWYFDDVEISGANTATYTPQESGTYHVEITSEFGCNAVSETVNVTITGFDFGNISLEIFPIPSHNSLNIKGFTNLSDIILDVYDIRGVRVNVNSYSQSDRVILNTSSLVNGIYILKIKSGDLIRSTKFIKN